MKAALRLVGVILLLSACFRSLETLGAPPGEARIVTGFLLPIVWIAAGYGLLRLREWGRRLALLVSGFIAAMGVLGFVIGFDIGRPGNVFLNGILLSMLVLGVAGWWLLGRKGAIAAVQPVARQTGVVRKLEGWLSAVAALALFGSAWVMLVIPLTIVFWDYSGRPGVAPVILWYSSLAGVARIVFHIFAGGCAVGLVWLSLAAASKVASYFYNLAVANESVGSDAPG